MTTDLRAAGQLAARHLLDCGLGHFVYAALPRLPYVRQQYEGFADTLREAGYTCPSYQPSFQSNSRKGWAAQEQELAQWIESLPKPVGMLAWGTTLGRQLTESCHQAGLHVPEDVAILGGDYDELLCETCIPQLAGVEVPSEQIGYEAALHLDRLMRGEGAPADPVLIEPQGVVARPSTDMLAIEDRELAEAIRFIRNHATQPLEVSDVLRGVAVSRRQLERGFQKVLGRSPLAEIRRRRVESAKRMLTHTDLPIRAVAAASGFGSHAHFTYVFKRQTGLSPLKYRSATRAR